MNVAITCDALIENDHLNYVVETVLSLYPEAVIYSLVHLQGKINPRLESRPIKSSFLSRLVKEKKDLAKWSFLAPWAAKTLQLPCSVDLVVNISSGLSHTIKKCEKTKQVTYFYGPWEQLWAHEDYFWRNKFLKSFLFYSSLNLKNVDKLLVSSDDLKQTLQAKVQLCPPTNLSDYPLFPQVKDGRASELFPFKKIVINSKGLTLDFARELFSSLQSKGEELLVMGESSHLEPLSEKFPQVVFFGERCSSELAPVLAGSKLLIDLSLDFFPKLCISTLASGRPIILRKGNYFISSNELGVKVVSGDSASEVCLAIEELSQENFLPGNIRQFALNFHELKFKAQWQREVVF